MIHQDGKFRCFVKKQYIKIVKKFFPLKEHMFNKSLAVARFPVFKEVLTFKIIRLYNNGGVTVMYEKLFESVVVEINNVKSDTISTETKDRIIDNVREGIRIRIKDAFETALANELIEIKKKEIYELVKKENPGFAFGDLNVFIEEKDIIKIHEINSMMALEKLYSKVLERIYENTYADARKLLKVLSLKKYNISDKKSFEFYPSELKDKSATKSVIGDVKISAHKFGTGVTARINNFLIGYNGVSCVSKEKTNDKYYISFCDIIPFFLQYIFYEGKVFPKNNEYEPKYSDKNSYSFKSYQIVLSHVLKLFTDKGFSNPPCIDRVFEAVQLHRINNDFKFFQINRVPYHRDLFMTEEFINKLFLFFEPEQKKDWDHLTSKERKEYEKHREEKIEEIRKTIDKEIFKNDEFIKSCLSSNHPDPVYMLSVYINAKINRYYFYRDQLNINEEKVSVDEFISECKQETLEYINNVSDFYDKKSKDVIGDKDLSEDELFKFINVDDVEYIFAKFSSFTKNKANSISYWQEYYFDNRNPLDELLEVNKIDEDELYVLYLVKMIYPDLFEKAKSEAEEK